MPADNTRPNLLSCRDLSKIYGERIILRQASLDLPASSLTLLLGRNGAGKSTLLRILAGLARPTSGHVEQHPKAALAYLGHATFLYPALTAFENLEFQAAANRRKLAKKDIMALLEKVGLEKYADEPARHFSRGMAQRLNFARTLASQPNVLLLDEPFTGLDRQSAAFFRAELLALRNSGCALLLVSHAPREDARLAQYACRLENGRAAISAIEELDNPAGDESFCPA